MSEVRFCTVLHNAIAASGLSRPEVEKQAGLHPGQLSDWLVQGRIPNRRTVEKLRRILNLPDDIPVSNRGQLTEEQEDEIIKLRKQGMSYDDIRDETGHSYSCISRVIHDADMHGQRASGAGMLVSESDGLICEMYQNGATWSEIMAQAKCSKQHISEVLKRNNITTHRKYMPRVKKNVKLVAVGQVEEATLNHIDREIDILDKPIETRTTLQVIRSHTVSELQGCVCTYKVDTDSDILEFNDDNEGTLVGCIMWSDIPKFIEELQALYTAYGKGGEKNEP